MPEQHPDPESVQPSAAFHHLVSIRSEVQSALADRRYGQALEICDDGVAWARAVENLHIDDRVAYGAVTTQQAALMVDSATIRMVNDGYFDQVRNSLREAAYTLNNVAEILPMAAAQCVHERPSLDGVFCIREDPCPPEQ